MVQPERKAFGDFQTPDALAAEVCEILVRRGFLSAPDSIVEPTCGVGGVLHAATTQFPGVASFGFELNESHARLAAARVPAASVTRADFFAVTWSEVFETLPQPILVIGNPPWVTSAELSTLGSSNLPQKSARGRPGLDAVTGKSNFDISEWMLRELAEQLDGRRGALAMLCKTTVARKVLEASWRSEHRVARAALFAIDAQAHFDASVDACFLVMSFDPGQATQTCEVFPSLGSESPDRSLGLLDDALVADVELFRQDPDLAGPSGQTWRSGIKHDCARVMELRSVAGGSMVNGLGEEVDVEKEHVFPMLKSSDLAHGRSPTRYMLVPQQRLGEPTEVLREHSPRTWDYLERHGDALDGRKSRIYRDQPRFSVFGIGEYTFAPWKVAISGFYKSLEFRAVGPVDGKTTVFDDTCYFVPCDSESEALRLAAALNGRRAQGFFRARVFWDSKRPVTSALLRTLNLERLLELE